MAATVSDVDDPRSHVVGFVAEPAVDPVLGGLARFADKALRPGRPAFT